MTLRVLHVLSSLGVGGIEKWLVNLTSECRRLHGGEVQFEFLTLLKPDGCYQRRLEELGCPVQHCQLSWKALPVFLWNLRRTLERGRYDAVHCHANYLSGLVLPVARSAGIKRGICHVHSTQFRFAEPKPPLRHWAGRVLRRMSLQKGSLCVGCSAAALDAYLAGVKRPEKTAVMFCGVRTLDYQAALAESKAAARAALGLPLTSKVILHVGSHVPSKNLHFLLEICRPILVKEPGAAIVLAGSGPLTGALKDRARELGIASQTVFLGIRDDIPRIMRAADLLLFPSLFEGLPVTVVEAQAMGLRSLIADHVAAEVELVKELVHRFPLAEPPEKWSRRALQLMEMPPADAQASFRLVEASPFNITHSARALMALYAKQSSLP